MSLISDAIKTAQRERTGRAQSPGKEPQPLMDGFFPYVSSSPTRSRSRLVPVAVISLATLGLLAVVGWLMLPSLTGSRTAKVKSPIILPPRAASAPARKDSAPTRADSRAAEAVDSIAAPTASGSGPRNGMAPAPVSRSSEPRRQTALRSADPRSTRSDTTIVNAGQRLAQAPAPARNDAAPTRVDYEGQATVLFNAGDLAGARDKFMLATRYAPTARAWTNYGVTLQRLGDLTGAAAAYQSAIGIDANYLEAWLFQGRLAELQGDAAKAVPLFQRARSINPRNSEVNVELARLESDARNWTEARRFAEDAVRGDPSNARAHWYLAISTDQLQDFEAATREYAAYLQTVGSAERDQSRFVGYARQRLTELRGKP
jgi:Flp pilus assembly protein TadD